MTIADNTTLTPLGQRPLDLGIDVVVSSDTKAMGGHSDMLMGHVASRNAQIMERVEEWRKVSGSIPGPHEAWLLHRGLETLDVRFDRMCSSAQVLAERLAAHPLSNTVRYPGLPDDRLARAGTGPNRAVRVPAVPDTGQRSQGRGLHQHLPLAAPRHLVWWRPQFGRAPRALG